MTWSLNKQIEAQSENAKSQTAKIKELFLKEYEHLIVEKNNEIKGLNEELSNNTYETKELKLEVKGTSF